MLCLRYTLRKLGQSIEINRMLISLFLLIGGVYIYFNRMHIPSTFLRLFFLFNNNIK